MQLKKYDADFNTLYNVKALGLPLKQQEHMFINACSVWRWQIYHVRCCGGIGV